MTERKLFTILMILTVILACCTSICCGQDRLKESIDHFYETLEHPTTAITIDENDKLSLRPGWAVILSAFKCVQKISDSRAIIKLGIDNSLLGLTGKTYYYEGITTEFVDGEMIKLTKGVIVDGTHTYSTASGGSKTLHRLRLATKKEIDDQQAFVDNYHETERKSRETEAKQKELKRQQRKKAIVMAKTKYQEHAKQYQDQRFTLAFGKNKKFAKQLELVAIGRDWVMLQSKRYLYVAEWKDLSKATQSQLAPARNTGSLIVDEFEVTPHDAWNDIKFKTRIIFDNFIVSTFKRT